MTAISDTVPARGLLEELVRMATLAPSVRNSQPWLFRTVRDTVEVLADDTRRQQALDPQGREQHISLGAATCNLRVAMTARGLRPVVRLLPDPGQPDLVATVRAAGPRDATAHDRTLSGAITNRRTTRMPFSARRLDATAGRSLEVAAAAEGARLRILDPVETEALLSLWPSTAAAAAEPTIAVLATDGDDRRDWLRAGVALERVLLEATVAGIATSCMSLPLEVASPRARRDGRSPGATQMILRLGYTPQSPRTPRRPVEQVLLHDAP